MFNVDIDTYGLEDEDSEEVIDPFYIDQVECMPIPKIDQGKREENDLFSRIKDVLTRTENWLKSKNAITPKLSEKSSKA